MLDNLPPPYYQDELITLYHADCRDILPDIRHDACLTDPVWPDASPELAGKDRAAQLMHEAFALLHSSCRRIAVWLGVDTDPRVLTSVPSRYPFFTVIDAMYARPKYKGRLLWTGDLIYLFGELPARIGSYGVIGRRTIDT